MHPDNVTASILNKFEEILNDPLNHFYDYDSCKCKMHLEARIETIKKEGFEYASKCVYFTLMENIRSSVGICNHNWRDAYFRQLVNDKVIAEPWLWLSLDLLKYDE